jgi:hypothetical protein
MKINYFIHIFKTYVPVDYRSLWVRKKNLTLHNDSLP